jgi:site-specific recombinase XerD
MTLDDPSHKTQLYIGTPKSIASIRDIPLEKNIIKEIMNHKRNMVTRYGKDITSPTEFVVTHRHEHPVEPKTLQEYFKKLIEKSGIEKANYHSLRHTFATRCIESGIPAVVLKNWLGHTNIHITLDIYTDVFNSMNNKAVGEFDKYLESM